MKTCDKRNRILKFIADFIHERDYPPTMSEIQRACQISAKSVVEYHLKVLEHEGYIRRDAEVTRGIKVSGMGRRTQTMPLLGTIAAGKPIPAPTADTWHNVAIDTIDVPADLLPREVEVYALKVKGTSMIDALVDDGDIVILKNANTAEDGEMVAVWLKDRQEVTLKKIYQESDHLRLQPANRGMEPIYCQPQNVEIQGKVIAVLRKLETSQHFKTN